MMSDYDRELNAHFYNAASLKYHAPDTWHDTKLTLPNFKSVWLIFYDC